MRRNNIIKPRNNRASNSAIRAALSGDTRGDRKRKFPDPRSHHLQNGRESAFSEQREPVTKLSSQYSFIADGAKTSEFAYFKKLKKEAARSELHPTDREKSQFRDVESNHYEREKTIKLKEIFDEPKSSVTIVTERYGDHPCLTPPVRASKSSEKDMIFPLLNEKVTPINCNHRPSFSQSYPNDTGVQHCDKGIFGLKRRKLRQWVSGTLHQEIDEPSIEGFSLVSMLLNRLFPEDKENRDWKPKYSQAEISAQDQLPLFPDDHTHFRGRYGIHKNHFMGSGDAAHKDHYITQYLSKRRRNVVLPELENVGANSPSTSYPIKNHHPHRNMKPYHIIDASIAENLLPESSGARYQLPLFPHDNTHSKEHYRMHTNHLVESENSGYQDYCFTRYLSECHSDVILPDLGNADADFPSATYPIKTYFPCRYVKPKPHIDASSTESLFPDSDSCFELQSEQYGSLAWENHHKNFDECHDQNGSLLQGEPHTFLLGWDYNNDQDEQGLSISSYNRNMNLLAHSGDNDHWQSHDRQDESAFSSSSLVSRSFLNCNSLMVPSSANFCSARDSGRYFKYENYLYAKPDHFPVPFSCNPDSLKYLCCPLEDFSKNNQLETRNVVFSTQDRFWDLNKVIRENNFHDQESLFFSTGLDLELGEKHLLISDHSTEKQLSMVHAYQYPRHVGPAACFLGEEDKECFLYNPRISIQRHSSSWEFPILERYHTEADGYSECEFE